MKHVNSDPDRVFDEIATFNRERWNELALAGVEYSIPALELDEKSARRMVDEEGMLGEVRGKRVLCLAAGGGQQTAAFALLGAEVTVLDISEVQLQRDSSTAKHYGLTVRTEFGDMRDLTRFSDASFDFVWQAHSINFVPDARRVFAEVSRVLDVSGLYRLQFTNPFIHGTWEESWTGKGYMLAGPYANGEIISEEAWTFRDANGGQRKVARPREFRHTLGTIMNGLIVAGMQILGLWEDSGNDKNAVPGSWEHFKRYGAPWITVISRRTKN